MNNCVLNCVIFKNINVFNFVVCMMLEFVIVNMCVIYSYVVEYVFRASSRFVFALNCGGVYLFVFSDCRCF